MLSRLIALLLFIASLACAGVQAVESGDGAALQTIDFQLRWKHQFQFAGYYAAIEKGFYREAGFDVRLHEGSPGRLPVDEVLAGRAQYAVGNSEVLYARLKGKPLVALAAVFQHSPSVLLVRADSGIRTPHDLVGRSVMLMNGEHDSDFLAMLLREGIKPAKIRIQPSSFEIADLIAGRTDAFNAYLTNEPFLMRQKGIAYSIINPGHYGIDYYSDILFTTDDEVRTRPERVEAFRSATLKGWQYAMDHPGEIIELLIRKYKVGKSREHLEYEARVMRSLILPDLVQIGHMNPGRWEGMSEAFKSAGMVPREARIDGFVYDPNPRLWEGRLRKVVTGFVVVVGVILLILIGVLVSKRRLLREVERRRVAEQALVERACELELHNRILRDINQGMPLVRLLESMVKQIEDLHPKVTCAVLLIDRNGQRLRHGAAPSLPEAHVRILDGMPIQDGASVSALAAARGERVIVADLLAPEVDPSLRREGDDAGVRAIWAEPVIDHDGVVLGVFSIYHPAPVAPAEDELVRLETYASLTALVIERYLAEDTIRNMAYCDTLTQLPNRRMLDDRLAHAMAVSKRSGRYGALMFVDLDNFKPLNDVHGHALGDQLLIHVARRLSSCVRGIDTVGRFGGDEFVVLLNELDTSRDASREQAMRVAEKVRAVLSAPYVLTPTGAAGTPACVEHRCTASIGVVLFLNHESTLVEIVKRADHAMYVAKDEGRNRICFAD